MYNRRIHYPETEYLIENISREDVKRCVTQIIDSKEKCIALLGNLDYTPPVFPDVAQINDPEKVHEEAFCKNIITARKCSQLNFLEFHIFKFNDLWEQ